MNKNINLLFSVLLLVGCGSNTNVNYTGQIPKNQGRVHLELDNYKSIASFASKDLVPFLFEEDESRVVNVLPYDPLSDPAKRAYLEEHGLDLIGGGMTVIGPDGGAIRRIGLPPS